MHVLYATVGTVHTVLYVGMVLQGDSFGSEPGRGGPASPFLLESHCLGCNVS